ncbi:GNAT family N-acetyltransferase [Granulicella sp. L60]|uniref:GNAT family N-acetyltransferase n=1 Tax=Granulicella sp. L60 TaxID=1641866 RepID=UPI00210FFA32|nr:GNAT family N-acetyltransferase [Granulicella sp. L60]
MSSSLVLEPPPAPLPSAHVSSFPSTSTNAAALPTSRIAPTPSQLTKSSMHTRPAQLQDAHAIHQLIDSFSYDGTLLRRSYTEICQNIRTFTVVESDAHQFIGCAALHVYGPHLAEVRSIVVRPDIKGHGAGGLLVQAILDQAEACGIRCVCLFTRIPSFFEHFNFHLAEHRALRDKILKDCIRCARRNACDETAMAIGELPSPEDMSSIHLLRPQQHADLVQLQL